MSGACHESTGWDPSSYWERDVVIPELFSAVRERADEALVAQRDNRGYNHVLSTRDHTGRPYMVFAIANEFDGHKRRIKRADSDELEIMTPVLAYSESETATIVLDDINADGRSFKAFRYSEDRKKARWWEVTKNGYQEFGDLSVPWPDSSLYDLLQKTKPGSSYQVVPLVKL